MENNIFCRHVNAAAASHIQRNPLFSTFCITSRAIAQSSPNDADALTQAKTIYTDQFKITDPPWTPQLASQWLDFFGKSALAHLNVYFLHVNNPNGLCNRGAKFTEFIQRSHEWSEKYDQKTACATAEVAYKKMMDDERKPGDLLGKPVLYPAWCDSAWIDYFYTIACSDACRQQQRKKRRIEMEDASAVVFQQATHTLIYQMQDGDTKDVMQVTGAYSAAAAVYQKLYLNKDDVFLKKNT